jgi:hypothetical protein
MVLKSIINNSQIEVITKDANEVRFSTANKTTLASPSKTRAIHPEEAAEIRAKEIHAMKHIYHDDNFARTSREEHKAAAVISSRTWLPSDRILKSAVASHTCVVTTTKPPNQTALGLTPLRQYGGGQDKPHHIAVAKNVQRLNTR